MAGNGNAADAAPKVLALEDLALPRDLFVIPDGDRVLLYAPLALAVASVNPATVARLTAGPASIAALDRDLLDPLVGAGILVGSGDAEERPTFAGKEEFDPDGITLFLTTRCTLACTYCYASGGERPSTMSWETARTSLDWMLRHAAERGRERVGLMFHGGGEVTTAWKLLERSVDYARDQAAARGLKLTTSAGLNGVMAGPLLEWVLAHIDCATVSIDGLPDIHDVQRPLRNGRGSHERIAATIRRMDEAGYPYGLRSTVTRAGVGRMAESVEHLCRSFGTRLLHLEPVFAAGRGVEAMSPDPLDFVRGFREARAAARAHGRELKYSGARFGVLTNTFCEVSADQLSVTPAGDVTACYEIGDRGDPRAATFIYGRVNNATGEIDLDEEKVRRLRTLTVEHKAGCEGCFCRWSCAGECAAKLALDGDAWDTSASPRCVINRELTLDQMREYLDQGGPRPAPEAAAAAPA